MGGVMSIWSATFEIVILRVRTSIRVQVYVIVKYVAVAECALVIGSVTFMARALLKDYMLVC